MPQEPTVLRFLILTNALLDEWPTAVAQYELGMRLFTPWREAENLMRHLRVGRNELEEARAIPTADPINAAMIANLDAPQTALLELRRLYAVTGPTIRMACAPSASGRAISATRLWRSKRCVRRSTSRAAKRFTSGFRSSKKCVSCPEFKAFLREIGIVEYWQEYGWPDICRPLDGDDFDCD